MNNQNQDKKFVCESCSSESHGTHGTCCGVERKEVVSKTNNGEHNHGSGHSNNDGHEHNKQETAGVCSACQESGGTHTCGV